VKWLLAAPHYLIINVFGNLQLDFLLRSQTGEHRVIGSMEFEGQIILEDRWLSCWSPRSGHIAS
jgi:hypothetical protein